MKLSELKEAVSLGKTLVWDDPEPIDSDLNIVSFIQDLSVFDEFGDEDMEGVPILIQYNDGSSEAEVPVSELYTLQSEIEDILAELETKLDNNDLKHDLPKIKEFDSEITVAKSEDFNLEYPYAIDVEDTSYWYVNENERDIDFDCLREILDKENFKFV